MKSKNKIFIAAEIFPPAVGGPATYTVKLANELIARDFKVSVLCYGKPDKKVLNPKIKLYSVSNKWPIPLKYFLYFKKLFWFSTGFKTIYAMGPVASGLPAKLVSKLKGKKLIVKVVGDYAWEQAINLKQTNLLIDEFQTSILTGKIKKLQNIQKKTCTSTSTVIVPSEYLKKIVSGWGIKEDKIKVIYNSFELNNHSKNNTEFYSSKKTNTIISVGRLVPWKGFETLIQAIQELNHSGYSFDLQIFGSGPLQEKLEKKLGKKITSLNKKDLQNKIQSSEMFILNTGYEGLSHVILESLGLGTPVVTTNIGGNPELIQDGINGTLIEYNNKEQIKQAILELHKNPELRQKYIENGKKVLENFSPEKMYQDTINILNS
jgi:glycosyltransferase involved in cell wall biosynthesis